MAGTVETGSTSDAGGVGGVGDVGMLWVRISEALRGGKFVYEGTVYTPDAALLRLPEKGAVPMSIMSPVLYREYDKVLEHGRKASAIADDDGALHTGLRAAALRAAGSVADLGHIHPANAGHIAMSIAEALIAELGLGAGNEGALRLAAGFATLFTLDLQARYGYNAPTEGPPPTPPTG